MKEPPNNSGSVSEKMAKDEKVKSARTRMIGEEEDGRDGKSRLLSLFVLPHLQIDRLDPQSASLGVHHHPGMNLLHHAVFGQEPHRLADLRPPVLGYAGNAY